MWRYRIGLVWLVLFLAVCFVPREGWGQRPKHTYGMKPSAFLKFNYDVENLWNGHHFDGSLGLPIVMNDHWMVQISAKYQLTHLDIDKPIHGYSPEALNINGTHQSLSESLVAFMQYKVANRTLMGGVIGSMTFSEHGFGGVSGVVILVYHLVETDDFSFGLGGVGIVNTALRWPAYPLIWLKWQMTDGLSLQITPPQAQFMFRATKLLQVGVRTALQFEKFYFSPEDEALADHMKYSAMLLRTGAVFEFRPIFPINLTAEAGFDFPCVSKFVKGVWGKKVFDVERPLSGFFMIKTSLMLL